MGGDLDDLASAAADALVSAMVTDSWQAVRGCFAAIVGHERRMDAARAELAAVNGTDGGLARMAQVRMWSTRLRDALDDDPGAAEGLRALLTELGAAAPAGVPADQRAQADHGSQAVNVGGNISGNTGEVYVGVGKVDKRKVNIALAPFVFLIHVVKKMAAEHPVTMTAGVAAVVAAAAVTGWQTRWPPVLFGGAAAQTLTWTAAEAPLPSGAAPLTGGGPNNSVEAQLIGVACPTAGCVTTGIFQNGNFVSALIETVSRGRWVPDSPQMPIPAGAAAHSFPWLTAVTCSAPGNCAAAGTYSDNNSNEVGLIATLSNEAWTTARLPLPSLAGRDKQAWMADLACPTVGNCVAVGYNYYANSSGTETESHAMTQTLAGGTWTAAEAPLPADAAQANGTSHLYDIACTAPGSCVAVGNYADMNGSKQGMIETLANGTWTAAKAPLPRGAAARQTAFLNGMSCPVPGSCVAVGSYTATNGSKQALTETLANGTWNPEQTPGPSLQKGTELDDVACTAPGYCAAVGDYTSKISGTQGLIETLANGTWITATAPLPRNATRSGQSVSLYTITCAAPGNCMAVGSYADTSKHIQGLIETTAPLSASPGALSGRAVKPPSVQPSPSSAQPSQSTALAPAPVIAPGHDTPQDAVDGLIQGELAGDWTQACSYSPPEAQAACNQQAPQLSAFTGNATVDGAMISGSEALVEVTGSMCGNGAGCSSNSDPAAGMPDSQATFQQVYDQLLNSNSSSTFSPVPCIEENGMWYVNYTR